MTYVEAWFRRGVDAWIVGKTHTYDSYVNNTFIPTACVIESVRGDTITLTSHTFEGTIERDVSQVYPSCELCQQACPPGYSDD